MYTFKYRRYINRNPFFVAIKHCVGHEYDAKNNVMNVFTKGGGIRTIRAWKECELKLGEDFGTFIKETAEREAGQPLKVKS